jgi:CHASE2 domain-containing sensor protein
MKLLTTLLLAALVALGVYVARRRILYALRVGAIAYVVLLFGRLLISMGSMADRWEDLIWPILFLLLAWVILWWVSTTYAERRDQEKRRRIKNASEAGRPAR